MKHLIILTSLLTFNVLAEGTVNGSLNSNSGNTNSNNNSSVTEIIGDTYQGSSISNTRVQGTAQAAVAPTVTAGYDTCSQSVSGGVSVVGFGASYGKSVADSTCELIKLTKLMQGLGLTDGAIAVAMQDQRIAKAIKTAYPELYSRLKPVTTTQTTSYESDESYEEANLYK